MGEFYTFNPKELKRLRADIITRGPERRAGHSMIAYEGDIYLFGGRGVVQTHDKNASNYKEIYALNDVWKFDEKTMMWNIVDNKGDMRNTSEVPVGRQDAAMAMVSGHLFIYGGRHPSYTLIFSDMWSLDIVTGRWKMLKSLKTYDAPPYSPPPMYKANAISIDKDCGNSMTRLHEDEIYGVRNNPNIPDTVDSECGLLIYGGVFANDLQTSIGQVYRLNLDMEPFETSAPINASTGERINIEISNKYLTISSTKWEYARLTSEEQVISRGRLRKLFAYEEIVYSKSRNLMYEFGGLQAVRESLIAHGHTGVDIPVSLEAGGGRIEDKYYDLETGEHLRTSVELPTNGPWNYTTAYTQSQPQLNFTDVKFLREFRTYRINYKDLVQVTVQNETNSL